MCLGWSGVSLRLHRALSGRGSLPWRARLLTRAVSSSCRCKNARRELHWVIGSAGRLEAVEIGAVPAEDDERGVGWERSMET
jgi:hypothetical protein